MQPSLSPLHHMHPRAHTFTLTRTHDLLFSPAVFFTSPLYLLRHRGGDISFFLLSLSLCHVHLLYSLNTCHTVT